jgi:hypothetical protein
MLLVDNTIALGPSLEGRLAVHGLACTYAPLSLAGGPLGRGRRLLLHSYLPDGHLRRLVRCRYIGVRAVRTDYVNLPLAAAQGIAVQGLTRQYGVNAVAEHTFALIFGLAKHLGAADGNGKGGRWRSGLPANWELKGRTLGIVGYGKIGQRVAEIGRALGMKVLVAGRGRPEGEVALEALLAQADIVRLHLPASEANRDFLNAGRIAQIKEGAMVINTTRGLVADYDALSRPFGQEGSPGWGWTSSPRSRWCAWPWATIPGSCAPPTGPSTPRRPWRHSTKSWWSGCSPGRGSGPRAAAPRGRVRLERRRRPPRSGKGRPALYPRPWAKKGPG